MASLGGKERTVGTRWQSLSVKVHNLTPIKPNLELSIALFLLCDLVPAGIQSHAVFILPLFQSINVELLHSVQWMDAAFYLPASKISLIFWSFILFHLIFIAQITNKSVYIGKRAVEQTSTLQESPKVAETVNVSGRNYEVWLTYRSEAATRGRLKFLTV